MKAFIVAGALSLATGGISAIPKAVPTSPADEWRYADLADVFVSAPVVLRAKIISVLRLKTPPAASGAIRFYVEANVVSLIRGPRAVPPRLAWLVDLTPDSRGKIARLAKADVLAAALPVPGRPGELRLAARDAQIVWSAPLEARVRSLVASVTASDGAPAITGITGAFHTKGTINGEGETQIFISTVTEAPISITVLTRPNQPKRWAFALGEIVDESAAPPVPDTLAWYRLACFLPRALPDTVIKELSAEDAASARADYMFVVEALGACPRVRG